MVGWRPLWHRVGSQGGKEGTFIGGCYSNHIRTPVGGRWPHRVLGREQGEEGTHMLAVEINSSQTKAGSPGLPAHPSLPVGCVGPIPVQYSPGVCGLSAEGSGVRSVSTGGGSSSGEGVRAHGRGGGHLPEGSVGNRNGAFHS